MRIIMRVFMYLAALGLFLNLILHILGLLGGIPPAYDSQAVQASRYLNKCMIVTFVLSVYAANRICVNYNPKEYWKAALRGCPNWLKILPGCLVAYAFIFIILKGNHGERSVPGSPEVSGFGMAIYAISLAILYSALHVQEDEVTRKCPNGHQVSPTVNFCEECGAQILELQEPDK